MVGGREAAPAASAGRAGTVGWASAAASAAAATAADSSAPAIFAFCSSPRTWTLRLFSAAACDADLESFAATAAALAVASAL
jgi:hypothetical protein